jgi:hypothetical protein
LTNAVVTVCAPRALADISTPRTTADATRVSGFCIIVVLWSGTHDQRGGRRDASDTIPGLIAVAMTIASV